MTAAPDHLGKPVATALLRLCAAPESGHGDCLAQLGPQDWSTLVRRAAELRVLPLIAQSLSQSKKADPIPAETAAIIEQLQRDFAFMVLRRSKGVARTHAILSEAGLEPVFLKGAALAFDVYPSSVLRPSRDADILLQGEQSAAAQAALLASGEFARHPGVPYAAECRHHHFPLLHGETGMAVEVHHALLNETGWQGEAGLIQMLLGETHEVGVLGEGIRVPLPMANILHLAMHAGIASYLDNGPLALSDLHFLMRSSGIDPQTALDQAEQLGLGKAFAILTALADRYGAVWVTDGLRQRCAGARVHLPAAEDAILPTAQDLTDNKLARRVDRHMRKAGVLGPVAMALRPDPKSLAIAAGVEEHSARRWIAYPAWLAGKVRNYIRLHRQRDMDRDRAFRDWLKSG